MNQNWSQDVYLKAWNFATKAHHGQTYNGPHGEEIPYLNHIGSVAMELISGLYAQDGVDGNLAIQCALLHDTIEDTAVDFETIKTHFGSDVAHGVLALSKNRELPGKQAQMLDSLARIKRQPVEVWMVKLADRITNLSMPPAHWDLEKCLMYLEEAKMIHEHLHEASELLSTRLLARIEIYKNYL